MNGSYQINRGLKIARGLLLEIAEMGMPAAGEFLGQLIRALDAGEADEQMSSRLSTLPT